MYLCKGNKIFTPGIKKNRLPFLECKICQVLATLVAVDPSLVETLAPVAAPGCFSAWAVGSCLAFLALSRPRRWYLGGSWLLSFQVKTRAPGRAAASRVPGFSRHEAAAPGRSVDRGSADRGRSWAPVAAPGCFSAWAVGSRSPGRYVGRMGGRLLASAFLDLPRPRRSCRHHPGSWPG